MLPLLIYLPCPRYFFFALLREVADRSVLTERPCRVFLGTETSLTVPHAPVVDFAIKLRFLYSFDSSTTDTPLKPKEEIAEFASLSDE